MQRRFILKLAAALGSGGLDANSYQYAPYLQANEPDNGHRRQITN